MPAGTYRVSQRNIDLPLLLVRDANWSHSAFVMYDPTLSIQPVTQRKPHFINTVTPTISGVFCWPARRGGLEITESTAEKRAATKKELASTKNVALQFGVPKY